MLRIGIIISLIKTIIFITIYVQNNIVLPKTPNAKKYSIDVKSIKNIKRIATTYILPLISWL